MSGPPLNARSSIAFRRGRKSRAESGAKAPHSIWSAAIYRRFSVKALAFTTLPSARMARRRPIGGGTRPSNPHNGGTLLVGSDQHRSMTHRPSPGTTSVPLRLFGGTCLSGPPLNVGSSIPFCRGLKSRAESGAKAPHSIWSAAIHRRFLVKALAFTNLPSARMARRPIGGGTRPSNPHNGGTCLSGPIDTDR